MKAKSREISHAQAEISQNLESLVARYKANPYLRKPSLEAQRNLDTIYAQPKMIILDCCCGVGESSYHLAINYPDHLVVGIDKSKSRLSRKNNFKKNLPSNLAFLEGNILDYWQIVDHQKWHQKLKKVCLYYPNPYPKSSDLKKRWHGHPISQNLFNLPCEIELRTNWEIYFLEFAKVSGLYQRKLNFSGEFDPKTPITPFERKYKQSGHRLFRCSISSK